MKLHPLLLVLATACGLGPAEPGLPPIPTGPGKHVLFVGNSLTYFNSMPMILESLADSAGEPLLETGTIAYPDYSLEDHWNDGRAVETIERGGWHVVVMQQGPSSTEAARQLLIRYAARIDSVAREQGAVSALYSVWPTVSRQQDFPRSIESYRLTADSLDALFFPVGDAWLATWQLDPTAALYMNDGLHPRLAGSYLAALVMYAVLYDKSPVGLPASFQLRDGRIGIIPAALAATLQQAASSVTEGSLEW